MTGFMSRNALDMCKSLVYNNYVGLDGVYKLYYNKRMATYIMVSCDVLCNTYPIAFAIFESDNCTNLSCFVKAVMDLCIAKSQKKINTIFMIDKSSLQIKSINDLRINPINDQINWVLCRFHIFKI